MKRLQFVFFLCLGLFFSQTSRAAVFNVTNSSDFQTALTTAQANGENDTINLAAGTYIGEFVYNADTSGLGETYSLTIVGTDGKDNTIVTATNDPQNPSGDTLTISGTTVSISGITFSNNDNGVLINDVAFGDPYGPLVVSVQNCKFENNIDVGFSVEFSYDKWGDQIGSVDVANNVFDQNGADGPYYGSGVHIETDSSASIPLDHIILSSNEFTGNQGSEYGSGLYIYLGEGVSLVNPINLSTNQFTDNTNQNVGAGLYFEIHSNNTTISLTGNTFHHNTSDSYAGAAYIEMDGNNSTVTVGGDAVENQNTFTQNGDGNGNALYFYSGISTNQFNVSHNIFGGTDASDGNGTIDNGRGAVYASILGNFTFTNNQVLNNKARRYAGLYLTISGDSSNTSSVNISNNEFTGNVGDVTGGGLGLDLSCACTLTLNSNLISGNQADETGGAYITLSNGDGSNNVYITNNIIVNNQATFSGYDGGGLYLSVANYREVDIVNNTISANSTTQKGGGLYFNIGSNEMSVNTYNNIFWNNTAGQTDGQDIYIVSASNAGAFVTNDVTNICVEVSGTPDCVACPDTSPLVNECNLSSLVFGVASDNVGVTPSFLTGTGNTAFAYNLLESSLIMSLGNSDILGTTPPGSAALHDLVDFDYNEVHARPNSENNYVAMGAIQYAPTPLLSVDPASKDYGTVAVGSSSSQIFTLSNVGNATLMLNHVWVSDPNLFTLNFSPSTNPCGSDSASIAPNGSCNVEVSFNPVTSGSVSGMLVITSNDSSNPEKDVPLTGTTSDSPTCTPVFAIQITAPSGQITVGDNIQWNLTMSNTASCDSENTVLNLQLSDNQDFQSGGSVNASVSLVRRSGEGFTCSGSGTSGACNIGTFAANSSISLTVTSKVTAEGTLTLNGALTNQAGTATASALATAVANGGALSGTGCVLNPNASPHLSYIWISPLLLFVLIRKKQEL